MFALIDCNACYASCEQVYRPDLRGKPIVVLSNNDGCIVARNKQAKALNIPDLEPYFKIKHLLAQHQAQVFSSNYALYGDISRRIMYLLEGFGNAIEVYSIDEAFLDVSGFQDLPAHGQTIKQACWKQQRMPVSVGFAPTKTLAKLANHIAKKSARLNGVCVIESPEPWAKVFRKLPVKTVWGVGSRIARRLSAWGIHSAEDLRQQNPKHIRKDFGVTLERTVCELNGEPCLTLEFQPPPKKQIFSSRSFSQKVYDKASLDESIVNYATKAAEKLRAQKQLTQCVYLIIQTSRFDSHAYCNSMTKPLPYPTNDTRDIIHAALSLNEHLFRSGFAYVKTGIGLLDLVDEHYLQNDLFTKHQTPESLTMMRTLDSINRRYGHGTLFIAKQGIQPKWTMSRDMKSPAYTTRFQDIPVIKL